MVDNSPADKADGTVKSFQAQTGRNYVTLRKFAQIVELSYPTCLKLAKSGKVVAVKVGGNYRIYEDEVRRFLKQGNHPNPQPMI
jgi:excisionase family DNA binding protein